MLMEGNNWLSTFFEVWDNPIFSCCNFPTAINIFERKYVVRPRTRSFPPILPTHVKVGFLACTGAILDSAVLHPQLFLSFNLDSRPTSPTNKERINTENRKTENMQREDKKSETYDSPQRTSEVKASPFAPPLVKPICISKYQAWHLLSLFAHTTNRRPRDPWSNIYFMRVYTVPRGFTG